jgi:NAD(P)-dependent dehydrogenase (short-subunit alcohol dehydrogenase family)
VRRTSGAREYHRHSERSGARTRAQCTPLFQRYARGLRITQARKKESDMELGLKGKVAIVTGATEGIGKETARVLAQEGAKVAICSRRPAAVEATVAELKRTSPDVLGVPCDVAKPEDVTRLVEATAKQFGRIDILVNNAGTSKRGSFMENDDSVWATDFEMKVFGAIRLVKLVIPHMRKSGGGRIIMVTNIGAKTPAAG